MSLPYENLPLTRDEVDAIAGPLVLDFGTNWCGHCNAARPHTDASLASTSGVRHVRVEDGPGRGLGRSFRVKLWPTLIFLKDGQEIARVVRPTADPEIAQALAKLLAA